MAVVIAAVAAVGARGVTVTFWHVGIYDEVIFLRQVAEQFEQQTGIEVHIQPVPWGNFNTKYLTALAAGAPPDAGTTSLAGPMEYGKVGGLLDLERRYPEAVARLRATTFPGMWPGCYFRGRLYGIPVDATALVGFYRKDIFASMGLEAPATWSELEHVLDALTAEGYSYGFLWTRNASWGLGTFAWPYGIDSYSDDGLRPNWLHPDFLKGYRFAIHLWNGYNVFVEKPVEMLSIPDPKQAAPLFFDFSLRYSEIVTRAPHMIDKLGVFPFPHPDDAAPATMMGGRAAVVFREAAHPDEAMRWLEYLMSKPVQMAKFQFMGDLGERSLLDLSINVELWSEDLGMLPGHQDAYFEVYERLRTRESAPWLPEANRLLEQSMFRAQDKIQRHFETAAARRGMSIAELKEAIAAGALPDERAAYRETLNRATEDLLRAMSGQAQALIDQDRVTYEKYFGALLGHAPALENRRDVLDLAKWLVAALVVLFAIYVGARARTRAHWRSYLFVAPPILLAIVFTFVPILVALYLSFTDYNPVLPLSQAHVVGLTNYWTTLQSPVLWQSLGRSVYFAALVLPVQIAIAVALAACLDKRLWPDRLFKFMYFSPLVTSVVSVSLIWFALYAGTRYGWINGLLMKLDLINDPILFLRNRSTFLHCVMIMTVWQGLAFTILVLLAGFQNVPQHLYEAAEIDGAGPIRQFFSISLAALRPQIAFLVVVGVIGTVQVFEQIFMLGGGAGEAESKFGPDDSGMTIAPFIYRKGFEFFKMGEASAIAFILFAFLLVVTFFNLRFFVRRMD